MFSPKGCVITGSPGIAGSLSAAIVMVYCPAGLVAFVLTVRMDCAGLADVGNTVPGEALQLTPTFGGGVQERLTAALNGPVAETKIEIGADVAPEPSMTLG